MTHDGITYGVVAAVATDAATNWTAHIPEPSLQNAMYLVAIIWTCIQIYSKFRGK